MAAAESGNAEIVSALLNAGAPWNAQDSEGHTAGEYATGKPGILQLLLDFAVRAEMILGIASYRDRRANGVANDEYLKSKLEYKEGKLMDSGGEAVMMEWERVLMERHADIICASGGDVLNVGFGLGIIDGEIQKRNPRSHTIIEAHPDVYKHMCDLGWDKKAGVRLVFGRWQDMVHGVCMYLGV